MRSELDSVIAWLFEADTDLVIHQEGAEPKCPVSLADLACNAAQFRGITSILLVDHSMTPMLKAQR